MNTAALLESVLRGNDLTTEETKRFLAGIMDGSISSLQLAALLPALRMKGETPSEILGFVRAMRGSMLRIKAPGSIDVCGTGGDGHDTFNISTTVAFVIAGAGVKVAKHGNRAASSKSGSADVLEALGVNIDITPKKAEKVLQGAGITFLFAQKYHPALKQVAKVRREIKIRTVFNSLGPFANPADTKIQLIGVADPRMVQKLAEVAKRLSYKRVRIIHSADGLDEASLSAPTTMYDVAGSKITKKIINPTYYGLKPTPISALRASDPSDNARILQNILSGARGPKRDIAVYNSAIALQAAGVASTLRQGINMANHSIDNGNALRALNLLIKETNHE